MASYTKALIDAMSLVAADERTYVVGQTVLYGGSFLSQTLETFPDDRKIELPVCESFQLQFSLGLALHGLIPISVFPRQNFLLLAMSDLVNTVDKITKITLFNSNPHIIIRVASGTTRPIFPGVQHVGDFTDAFKKLLPNIRIYEMQWAENIVNLYKKALREPGQYLMIEHGDFYD